MEKIRQFSRFHACRGEFLDDLSCQSFEKVAELLIGCDCYRVLFKSYSRIDKWYLSNCFNIDIMKANTMAQSTQATVNDEMIANVSTDSPAVVTPLDETLLAIQHDAQMNPDQYLDETEVPDGGE